METDTAPSATPAALGAETKSKRTFRDALPFVIPISIINPSKIIIIIYLFILIGEHDGLIKMVFKFIKNNLKKKK